MDVASIRDGLQTALTSVAGLRCYDTIPDKADFPAAVIVPDDPFITYPETIGPGECSLQFRIVLVVSRVREALAQDTLDALLSTGTGISAVDALIADRTLGGVCSAVVVQTATGYRDAQVNGVDTFQVDLTVTMNARR